jgi:hypothetical protein
MWWLIIVSLRVCANREKKAMKVVRRRIRSHMHLYLIDALCKAGKYRLASRFVLSCLREGNSILKSAQRAVISGLRSLGYKRDVNKLLDAIHRARIWRFEQF